MTAVAQKTVLTGCLAPIDRQGLEQLIANGKANPKVIKTLKCKTVAEGKFRHANYIRNLPPYIVDEPPGLLGDDTAPNPSEASLAALGSCLAVGLHANAVHRGWIVNKLELAARGRPQHHRGLGHRRRQREAGRLHRRAGQGRHGMRGRSARARSTRWWPTSRSGRRSPTPSRARSISRSARKRREVVRFQIAHAFGECRWAQWPHRGRRSTKIDLPSASIADAGRDHRAQEPCTHGGRDR